MNQINAYTPRAATRPAAVTLRAGGPHAPPATLRAAPVTVQTDREQRDPHRGVITILAEVDDEAAVRRWYDAWRAAPGRSRLDLIADRIGAPSAALIYRGARPIGYVSGATGTGAHWIEVTCSYSALSWEF